jgi:Beta-propeller repeat
VCRLIVVTFPRWPSVESRPASHLRKACPRNSSGTAVIYSTLFGGDSDESGSAIAVDAIGNVYVTGNTTSTNFPTVHPFQPHLGGTDARNAFVIKIASDRTESLNLSGSLFFTGSSCPAGGPSCNANFVGWSGGFCHVPNGWTPFPGTEKALWEAHLNYEGDVAFGKTVALSGGRLDLLLQSQKLLSETVTNGTIVWPPLSHERSGVR